MGSRGLLGVARVTSEPHFHSHGVHTAKQGWLGQDLLSYSPPENLPQTLPSCLEPGQEPHTGCREPIR